MYSRRFYSSQRSRPAPVIQQNNPQKSTVSSEKKDEREDTRPMWATDLMSFDSENIPERTYPLPKDFLPVAEDVSVYPEKKIEKPSVETESENELTESEVVYDGDAGEKIKNMTFEDMMLTWLAMLGSSGEIDDEILLILGLMLMIGA